LQGVIAYGAIAVLLADPQVLTGPLALVGIVIAVIGLAVETISDYQLDVHRTRADSRSLFTGGLRRFVRYPNYAGEIAFWTGIALIGVDIGTYWGVLSAGLMLFLLRYVSGVSLLDERLKETRSEFATYAEQVPALVPTLSTLFGNSKIPDGARAFDDR
jgi:steroid 5-alpha reductase family enzyme